MLFLMWYSDNSKQTTQQKIQGGIEAYTQRNGFAPLVVAFSQVDLDGMNGASVAGVELVVRSYIRKNNFWLGQEAP